MDKQNTDISPEDTVDTPWIGDNPTECQICTKPIGSFFIDGKTLMGSWAIMCLLCHELVGEGLGTGKGQRFQWNEPTKMFWKVEG